jgi:hypothetical protein
MEPSFIRPWSLASCSLLMALWGCADAGSSDDDVIAEVGESTDASSETETETESGSIDSSESGVECSYPEGAVEPMELGQVLTPYSWPTAIHADGTTTSLDLLKVPCATDEVIDWSVHEILVFISIPSW